MEDFISELAEIRNSKQAAIAIQVPVFRTRLLEAVTHPDPFIKAAHSQKTIDNILVGLACFLPLTENLFKSMRELGPAEGAQRSLLATAGLLGDAIETVLIRYRNLDVVTQAQIDTLMARIESCEVELEGLDQDALRRRREARLAAKARLQKLLSALDEVRQELGTAESTRDALVKQVEQVDGQVRDVQQRTAEVQTEITRENSRLHKLQEQKAVLQKNLTAMQTEAAKVKRELDSLERSNDMAPKVTKARDRLREAHQLFQDLVSEDSELNHMMGRNSR